MTTIEALQQYNLRVSNGNVWLCWYEDMWTVFKSNYREQTTTIVIQTSDEADAVDALLKS